VILPLTSVPATTLLLRLSNRLFMRLNRDTGDREIVLMRWGLVPSWNKDQKIAYSTIKLMDILPLPAKNDATGVSTV